MSAAIARAQQAVVQGDARTIQAVCLELENINITLNNNWTLLLYACNALNAEIISILIEHGADVHAQSLLDQCTAGVIVAKAGSPSTADKCVRCLQILCQNGVNLNVGDRNGTTPLMFAALKGCLDAVQYLVDVDGVDINQQNLKGWSALFFAVDKRQSAIVKLLLQRGASIMVTDECGRTVRNLAATSAEMSRLLGDGSEVSGVVVDSANVLGDENCELSSNDFVPAAHFSSINHFDAERSFGIDRSTVPYRRRLSSDSSSSNKSEPDYSDDIGDNRQGTVYGELENILMLTKFSWLIERCQQKSVSLEQLLNLSEVELATLEVQEAATAGKLLKVIERCHREPWSSGSLDGNVLVSSERAPSYDDVLGVVENAAAHCRLMAQSLRFAGRRWPCKVGSAERQLAGSAVEESLASCAAVGLCAETMRQHTLQLIRSTDYRIADDLPPQPPVPCWMPAAWLRPARWLSFLSIGCSVSVLTAFCLLRIFLK